MGPGWGGTKWAKIGACERKFESICARTRVPHWRPICAPPHNLALGAPTPPRYASECNEIFIAKTDIKTPFLKNPKCFSNFKIFEVDIRIIVSPSNKATVYELNLNQFVL